jgi:hypothetical protein
MQCPRCGASVPDTASRCGRCDSTLQAVPGADPVAHQPAAAPIHDGPPPLRQQPLGAPLYDSGPPVQAFVESAEDSWRPLGPQPSLPAVPPPEDAGGLPPNIDPASIVPGHDLVLPSSPTPEPPPPPPPTPEWAPQGPSTAESVAERTMAVWLSDSPAAGPASSIPATPAASGPPGTPGASGDTPVYGTMTPPPNGPGGSEYGYNETAMLPGMAPGQPAGGPQHGGWQSETWQTAAWQQPPGYDDGPPQRPAGNAGKPLVITVVGLVVVALVAAGLVLWPDGGDDNPSAASASAGPSAAAANSPATTKTNAPGRRAAVAVNRVLNASAASRGALARALAAAGTCRRLPTAIVGFQQVATQRRTQLARTRALKVGQLANGARLRQTLARSIQLSLAVDQALLTWAKRRQGCKGKPRPDANYQRARGSLSAQASTTKAQFATLWAPVAKQHRLPSRTANGF